MPRIKAIVENEELFGNHKKRALELFTDRIEPQKVFNRHYDSLFEEIKALEINTHVIYFYGIGGIGKTTLLNKIELMLAEKEKNQKGSGRCIRFDFRDFAGSTIDIITALCNEMKNKYNFRFPMTELAALKRFSLTGQSVNLAPATLSEKIQNGKILGPFTTFAKAVVPILEVGLDSLDTIESSWDKNLWVAFKKRINSEETKDLITRMESMQLNEFNEYFHIFFEYDLNTNMKNCKFPLVIMLDTYEHYINTLNDGEITARKKDYWLRNERNGVIWRVPGIIWVIAGREKLKSQNGMIEKDSWDALEIDEHILGNLSETDSESYLRSDSVGITDKELIKHIIGISNGVPVILDICRQTYENLAADPQKQIDKSSYGFSFPELVERYLELMSPDMQSLVFSFSVIGKWTERLVDNINKDIEGFSRVNYSMLKRLSIVVYSYEDSSFHIHETVRGILLSKIDSEQRKGINNVLANYYAGKIKSKEASQENIVNYIKASLCSLREPCEIYKEFLVIINPLIRNYIEEYDFESASSVIEAYKSSLIQNDIKNNLLYFHLISHELLVRTNNTDFDNCDVIIAEMNDILNRESWDNRDHPDHYIDFQYAIARYYYANCATTMAVNAFVSLISFMQDSINQKDSMYYESLSRLSSCYLDLHEDDLAISTAVEGYTGLSKLFGEENLKTIEAMGELGNVFMHTGKGGEDPDLVGGLLFKAYSFKEKKLGNLNPSTVKAKYKCGEFLLSIGDLDGAEHFIMDAYHEQLDIKRREDPATVGMLINATMLFSKKKDREMELAAANEALHIASELYGIYNSETLLATSVALKAGIEAKDTKYVESLIEYCNYLKNNDPNVQSMGSKEHYTNIENLIYLYETEKE